MPSAAVHFQPLPSGERDPEYVRLYQQTFAKPWPGDPVYWQLCCIRRDERRHEVIARGFAERIVGEVHGD